MNSVKGRHEAADGLPSRELFRSRKEGGSHAWKRWVALGGLVGAPVSGALSACAFLMAYLFGSAELTFAGNVLIISVLPLLILGAAALDWLEADLGETAKKEHEEAQVESPAAPAALHVVRARNFRPIAVVALVGLLGALAPARAATQVGSFDGAPLTERERTRLDRVERLEQRVAELEAAGAARPVPPAAEPAAADVAPIEPAADDGARRSGVTACGTGAEPSAAAKRQAGPRRSQAVNREAMTRP